MEWAKFKGMFHESWHSVMQPFIESKECDEIYKFLKTESQKGKKIAPQSINTYRAFYETSLDELKCVIVGMDPYYKFVNDIPVADGLLFGCSITEKVQPSLQQFYNGIEQEIYNGLNLNYINTHNVRYLANQGVLMLNSALTVEKDKPGSHTEVWESFMIYLLKEVISKTAVPILFLGKEAQKYAGMCELTNNVFILSHPASASYSGTKWDTKGTFKEIGRIVWEQQEDSILWLNIDPPF